MRNLLWLLVLGLVAIAGCSSGAAAAVDATKEPTTTVAPTAAPVPTSTPVAAAAPEATTSTTTTTTTTTVPPLDRSDASTLVRMQGDLTALLANGPRQAGSVSEVAAADHIEDSLRLSNLDVTTEPVVLPNGETSHNVVAVVGEGPRRVVVGAHYDSIARSPGADDNGSGTVVLLELARRLAESPVEGLEVTIVLFGAEEVLAGYSRNDHHYGSRQTAARMAAAGTLPDEMLSVDMVGFGDTILAASYQDLDPAAAERLAAAAAAAGAQITVSSRGDISDHEAFARAGSPAVMMWRPSNPAYHSEADTTVNWAHMLQNLAIVETWLNLQL